MQNMQEGSLMSVITEANEKIEAAQDDIQSAIENLSAIVVDKVWGSDEFNAGYRAKIFNAFQIMVNLGEELKNE